MASKEIVKVDMSEQLPSWFEPKAGFKFTDRDNHPCMVAGWHVSTLIYVTHRKDGWFLKTVTVEALWGAKPGWDAQQEACVSGWL